MKPEDIEKQIQEINFRASDGLRKRILEDALKAQQKSKQTDSASTRLNIRRIIMKSPITKFAAAAVIILAVVFGIWFFVGGSTSVALADVLQKVEQVQAFMYKMKIENDGEYAAGNAERANGDDRYRFDIERIRYEDGYGYEYGCQRCQPENEANYVYAASGKEGVYDYAGTKTIYTDGIQ